MQILNYLRIDARSALSSFSFCFQDLLREKSEGERFLGVLSLKMERSVEFFWEIYAACISA